MSEHNFSKLKIDKIRRSPTLIISGYGAGIAILFSIFNDQLGMEKKWLATIDATLSICAIIFYTGIIHLISTTKALKELNKEKSNQPEPRKRIQTLRESPNKPSVMRESPQHLIRAAHEPDE
ncbi:hypothetical protein, partial [Pseudomonas aeruginosa]|uniref:hypothetical protein n=1 Tax=Pseudomonas aeruginosa TaxID=287 RepID=UPI001C898639